MPLTKLVQQYLLIHNLFIDFHSLEQKLDNRPSFITNWHKILRHGGFLNTHGIELHIIIWVYYIL